MEKLAKRLIDVGVVRLETDVSEEKLLLKSDFNRAYSDSGTSNCIEEALENAVEKISKKFVSKNDVVIACAAIDVVGWGYCVAVNRSQTKFTYVLDYAKSLKFSSYYPNECDHVILLTDCVMSGYKISSIVTAMRRKGILVIGIVTVFCSGYKKMKNVFHASDIQFHALTDIDELQRVAQLK